MSDGQKSGKNGKGGRFGVRPVFLIAGAIALLAFGFIFGAGLDVATRPPKPQVTVAQPPPKPSHQYVPPTIKIEPEAQTEPAPGSIFDEKTGARPAPQRAWSEP